MRKVNTHHPPRRRNTNIDVRLRNVKRHLIFQVDWLHMQERIQASGLIPVHGRHAVGASERLPSSEGTKERIKMTENIFVPSAPSRIFGRNI